MVKPKQWGMQRANASGARGHNIWCVSGKAQREARQDPSAALAQAAACDGFAAAENLAGRALLGEAAALRGDDAAAKEDEALGHFQKAALLEPSYTRARYNIGIIALKHQKLKEAIEALSIVV